VARKRQIGTRIDDTGDIAEAWDEYKQDYENKSSAMRQLMRRGLEVEEPERPDTGEETAPTATARTMESLTVGAVVTFAAWLAVTAASVVGLLDVMSGTLVVSGLVVVGFATTVFHLRVASAERTAPQTD
jgi:hypothetical protein